RALIIGLFAGALSLAFMLRFAPVQSGLAFVLWSAVGDRDVLVRYDCFGDTLVWDIYGEDNFLTAPDLTDYHADGERYKQCAASLGVAEYMPFPPLAARSQ